MITPLDNKGVLTVVLERFQELHLPRIMHIKELVDDGNRLSQSEINFLDEVFDDTRQYAHFVSSHKEFQKLFSRVTSLYDEIATKALSNEAKISKISTSN